MATSQRTETGFLEYISELGFLSGHDTSLYIHPEQVGVGSGQWKEANKQKYTVEDELQCNQCSLSPLKFNLAQMLETV